MFTFDCWFWKFKFKVPLFIWLFWDGCWLAAILLSVFRNALVWLDPIFLTSTVVLGCLVYWAGIIDYGFFYSIVFTPAVVVWTEAVVYFLAFYTSFGVLLLFCKVNLLFEANNPPAKSGFTSLSFYYPPNDIDRLDNYLLTVILLSYLLNTLVEAVLLLLKRFVEAVLLLLNKFKTGCFFYAYF